MASTLTDVASPSDRPSAAVGVRFLVDEDTPAALYRPGRSRVGRVLPGCPGHDDAWDGADFVDDMADCQSAGHVPSVDGLRRVQRRHGHIDRVEQGRPGVVAGTEHMVGLRHGRSRHDEGPLSPVGLLPEAEQDWVGVEQGDEGSVVEDDRT